VAKDELKALSGRSGATETALEQRVVKARAKASRPDVANAAGTAAAGTHGSAVRVAGDQYGAWLETVVAQACRADDRTAALALVKSGLPVDDEYRRRARRPPNYRVYDLWARCARADTDSTEMQELVRHVSRAWPGEPVLRARAAHWQQQRVAQADRPSFRAWPDPYENSKRFKGMWKGV
jgi:hypothetical protein